MAIAIISDLIVLRLEVSDARRKSSEYRMAPA